MQIIADLHTHTIASGHAYSTLQEMVQAAAQKGLKMLAITEHGPKMPGGPHLYYFYNIHVIPDELYGVRILKGVETNIIDGEGSIDLDDEYLEKMDLVLAGFHIVCSPEHKTVAENTTAMIKAIANPRVDAIVHPGNPEFMIDPLPVIQAAKQYGKAIEINNSSVRTGSVRVGSKEICANIAGLAKEYDVPIILSSDAHISFDVGNVENAIELATGMGLTEANVLNASLENINKFVARRKKERKAVLSF